MWPFPNPKNQRIRELETLVDQQAQVIHTLHTSLALAMGQPPPGPWPRPSSSPWPPSSLPNRKKLGAEAVSVMDRRARREADLRQELTPTHPLPEYMTHPTPPDPGTIPLGRAVGGGFSPPPNDPSPGNLPTPEPPLKAS